MAFESTMTEFEFEMDAGTQRFLQELRSGNGSLDPDLAVDGLTNGLFAALIRLFHKIRG